MLEHFRLTCEEGRVYSLPLKDGCAPVILMFSTNVHRGWNGSAALHVC